MASLEGVSRIFSIRVVTLHYYMAPPPIPDFDACYSVFQGFTICICALCIGPKFSRRSALCTCFCFSNRESFEGESGEHLFGLRSQNLLKWPGYPLWFISDVAAESPSVAGYVGEDVESISYKLLTVWFMTLTMQISHIGWSLLGLHFPSKYYIEMDRKMDIAHA
ncbi:hypothetical protein EJ110_NYTH56796 [Nymphaea thermarum]|nr:hypothetical protein EJ110_NYTH56796 [Nymphaea thermarum]